MACDSRLLDSESRNRAMQTIATNVERRCMLNISAKRPHEWERNGKNQAIFQGLHFVILKKGFISTVPSRQLNFVGKYLTGIEGYKMVDSQSLRRFVFHFSKARWCLSLRMVATHAGELPCYELAKKLYVVLFKDEFY
uniref:Uncharacterized protein n=1 Tax=Ditylenchus dipsaci TaxID=166011 RepID=A0A915E5N1_9BILA